MIKADVLVIGSGISGLSYAIKISEKMPEAKIIIVTKADEDESNTKYAQGGLAVVMDLQGTQIAVMKKLPSITNVIIANKLVILKYWKMKKVSYYC